MKQKLVDSLARRINTEIAPQNPVKFLKTLDLNAVVDIAIQTLFIFTRQGKRGQNKVVMAEIITLIGNRIRSMNKLKRDSGLSAKAGAFILWSFEEQGIIKTVLSNAANGHNTYQVEVLDEDVLLELWESIDIEKTEKLPSVTPYAPWTSTRHETGAIMVKTENKEVLTKLTPETHPMVYENLNKSMATGWNVNKDVYPIFVWALRNKAEAFADIWEMQNAEARNSKIREAKAVGSIAKKLLEETFYHLYYYDFRGRKYPATAYFNEQGTDAAKGMLLRADKKPIGESGFKWLLISIASNWAGDAGRQDGAKTDKIPLQDRVTWALDNEEILLSYAQNPKVNQGWMKADKPWQFLAACIELWKINQHELAGNEPFSFASGLECFIDGSNNGSQHLSALTRDEITAPHVNLIPLELPGDLYRYVADHVWTKINDTVSKIPPEEKERLDHVIDNLIDLKVQIAQAPQKSDRRAELITQIQKFKQKNDEDIKKAAPIFWARIKDYKHQRKVVKRNVMTLPYGGTAYGLGQQQIDDARKHGIESLMSMEHKWGSYMGREVFDDCRVSLKRPMQLLSVFEEAGRRAEQAGEFLRWNVPLTEFPVVQHYTEGKIKKLWIQYGPPMGERNSTGYYENTYQLAICFMEDTIPSPRKQSTGASPNAIHSLDAAHLMVTVCRAPFTVTTIHDSYGCLLGDMDDLFRIVRECFIELYSHDPLKSLMDQIQGDISQVEIGSLDLNLILQSEYCFA